MLLLKSRDTPFMIIYRSFQSTKFLLCSSLSRPIAWWGAWSAFPFALVVFRALISALDRPCERAFDRNHHLKPFLSTSKVSSLKSICSKCLLSKTVVSLSLMWGSPFSLGYHQVRNDWSYAFVSPSMGDPWIWPHLNSYAPIYLPPPFFSCSKRSAFQVGSSSFSWFDFLGFSWCHPHASLPPSCFRIPASLCNGSASSVRCLRELLNVHCWRYLLVSSL